MDKNRARLSFAISSQHGFFQVYQEKIFKKVLPFINSTIKYFESLKFDNSEAMMFYFFSVIDGIQINLITNFKFPIESIKNILKNQFVKS